MMPAKEPCVNCGALVMPWALTEDDWCPKCDTIRGAETLKGNSKLGGKRIDIVKKPTNTSIIHNEDSATRKTFPVYSGCVKYFPDAMIAVSKRSKIGYAQHHHDKTLHWDRSKSGDELDALMRHMIEGEWDSVAWRAMAFLQKQLEQGWRPQDW